jgi:hypothetical protein
MKVQYENKEITLPDFLLIGAAKSGTTTLFEYLNNHPEVFVPKKKELFYFSFGNKTPRYTNANFLSMLTWRTNDYINEFKFVKDKIIGECSTSYLYTAKTTIENIHNLYGVRAKDLRIIVILRNPVDRSFSHYTHLVRNGLENLPFEKAIEKDNIQARKNEIWGFDYLEYGNYANQLQAFLQIFPLVKVLYFEDLKKPDHMLEDLKSFLGLNTSFPKTKIKTFNPSGIPKHKRTLRILRNKKLQRFINFLAPKKLTFQLKAIRDNWTSKTMIRVQMNPETKKKLSAHYSTEIDNLAKLLNRSLDHWK